jgi:FMN phosphatase YigB (HAD superfamily)
LVLTAAREGEGSIETVFRALIFDLDNCLADAREVGEDTFFPAFEAIRQANNDTVALEVLDEALKDTWRHPFDWIVTRYGFSSEMSSAGFEAFRRIEVKREMHGYGDQSVLSEIPVKKFLVTSGFRRLQESKIAALGITQLFNSIIVDAIDEETRRGKRGYFEQIVSDHGLRPGEVMVVGDNADSEIAVGNQLGMVTVQTLRPGVTFAASANHHVKGLAELKGLLDI